MSDRCGWPVHEPGTSTTWWCGADLGHDGPHELRCGDNVLRTSHGYQEAR